MDVKSDRRRLAPGTIKEYRAAHEELIFILGDCVVEELRNEDAEKFYDALLRLPKNRKSFPEYAGRAYGGECYSGRNPRGPAPRHR